MRLQLEPPPATASSVDHADWLELTALAADDRSSSIQDLASSIRRTGTVEGLASDDEIEAMRDRGGEQSQSVAEDAFNELDDRSKACGLNRRSILSGSAVAIL